MSDAVPDAQPDAGRSAPLRRGVDPRLVFDQLPSPCVVLDPGLVIRDCNAAYLAVTGRRRENLVGRSLFDAFPDADPEAEAGRNVRRVLEQAMRSRRTSVLGAQRYDISPTDEPADLEARYWSTTAVPLLDAEGEVEGVLYNIHDVTALTEGTTGAARASQPRVRELFRAAVEVSEQARLFDDAVVAERQLGLAVQDAMLPTSLPKGLEARVAVRYRPASGVLHVGGDWYDVTQLDADRFAVAVGDVVGHGLTAAVLMGQLRAALNALTLANLGPADALAGLDRFARQDRDAALTTAVKLVVDVTQQTITYSSAGHPPPILLHSDGTPEFLDQAQGPALALFAHPESRPTVTTTFCPGSRLVLFTDGFVERRDTDLDTSLQQLAHRLQRGRHQPVEQLADSLLDEQAASQTDDIALLLVQL